MKCDYCHEEQCNQFDIESAMTLLKKKNIIIGSWEFTIMLCKKCLDKWKDKEQRYQMGKELVRREVSK